MRQDAPLGAGKGLNTKRRLGGIVMLEVGKVEKNVQGRPEVLLDGEGRDYLLSLVYRSHAFVTDAFNSTNDTEKRDVCFRNVYKVHEELIELLSKDMVKMSEVLESA